MPFLTDLDERAAVRGSRDPLGLVPLWSAFGRTVVGNLTTVSNSVRGFTTLLLGYYFVEQLGEKERPLEIFLKFEQLAAYCRCAHEGHASIRGIERVKRRLGAGKGVVSLSADADDQILANQRTYGLWGLFSGPARMSALIEERDARLSNVTRELVERRYLPVLAAAGDRKGQRIAAWLAARRAKVDILGKDRALCAAVAAVHRRSFSAEERDLYANHLLDGVVRDVTRGIQAAVARAFHALPPGTEFDIAALRALAKSVKGEPNGREVADRLVRIDQLERLLVPANALFEFALARHGKTLEEVANDIAKAWGQRLETVDANAIESLQSGMREAIGEPAAVKLFETAQALSSGGYAEALRVLVEHNAAVMASRGGSAAWARLENGKLDVRFRDESGALPDRSQVRAPWRSTYFLNSLYAVHQELRG